MSDMLEMSRGTGDQLRSAAKIPLPQLPSNNEFLVAGMGGSGTAGDFLEAVTAADKIRVVAHKDYGPPPGWADRARPLVVAVSCAGYRRDAHN